jgi:hypothetical protein
MRRSIRCGLVTLTLITGSAGALAAQETGTPIFEAPYRAFTRYELGVSLSDPGSVYDFALEGFYRFAQGPNDFSVRGGFANGSGNLDTKVLLGGDFRTQVLSYSESFPLDGALTLGFGASIGDGPDRFFLPVGVSVGRRFDLEGSNTTFVPYAQPVIIPTFGGGNDDVNFALGLGVDIRFSASWSVRASGALGDLDGVGVSLAYLR